MIEPKFTNRGQRILLPKEFVSIRNVIQKMDKDEYVTILESMLLLGARYKECQWIQNHPECFDGNFITIKNTKPKAIKSIGTVRNIQLSNRGKTVIRYFFKTKKKLPSVQSFDQNLKRWAEVAGVDSKMLSAKTLRKTWESWLNYCYPEHSIMIAQSQGHTVVTAMKHYIGMAFSPEDKNEMKEWIEGWRPEKTEW